MHSILGTWTNQAETWFNRCGLTDVEGDDGTPGDPGFIIANFPGESDQPVGEFGAPRPEIHDACRTMTYQGRPYQDIILEAWEEAGTLAQMTNHWTHNFEYQQAMDCESFRSYALTRFPIYINGGAGASLTERRDRLYRTRIRYNQRTSESQTDTHRYVLDRDLEQARNINT